MSVAEKLMVSVFLSYIDGMPVVQINTEPGLGPVRVYINDGAVWYADAETHEHEQCRCVTDWEASNDRSER